MSVGPPRVRRRRVSLRVGAAVAAVVTLTPLLVLGAVGAVLLQRHDLTNAVYQVAEEQARSVAHQAIANGSVPDLAASTGGEESLAQVVGTDGTVVEATSGLTGQAPLIGPPVGDAARRTQRSGLAGESDAYAVVGLPIAGTRQYVVVARSLETVEAATASTTRLLAVGVPVVVAAVGAMTWWATGRVLRPVEKLRSRASDIARTGVHQRLPQDAANQEIARLTDTLNDMLDRLAENARAQRQFVADASHELRSPIATIRTVTEVSGPDSDWTEVREDLLAEATRLEDLVAQLLSLARQDASPQLSEGAPLRLRSAVEAELARPRGTPVEVHWAADPLVRAHTGVLRTALGNLVDNAARHADTRVEVTVDSTHDRAVVTVADDGAGIPAVDLDRVFERFVRLDEARARDAGGAGLGLSISRALVVGLGGSLVAEDTAPDGARLRLELPLADKTPTARRGG